MLLRRFEIALSLLLVSSAFEHAAVAAYPLVVTNEVHTNIFSISFSQDDRTVAVGDGNGSIRIIDTTDGQLVAACVGHQSHVSSLAFSPDGKLLASAGDDGTVRLWRTAELIDRRTVRNSKCLFGGDTCRCVVFSPHGKYLAASGFDDPRILVWNVPDDALETKLRGHSGEVPSIAFSEDGGQLASAGFDRTLRTWNTRTWEESSRFKSELQLSCVIPVDGDFVVASWNQWDSHAFEVPLRKEYRHSSLPIYRWEYASNSQSTVLSGEYLYIYNFALTNDKRFLFAACQGGLLLVRLGPHLKYQWIDTAVPVTSVAVSRASKLVAYGSGQGRLTLNLIDELTKKLR